MLGLRIRVLACPKLDLDVLLCSIMNSTRGRLNVSRSDAQFHHLPLWTLAFSVEASSKLFSSFTVGALMADLVRLGVRPSGLNVEQKSMETTYY